MVYKTKGVCAQGIEFEIDDQKKSSQYQVYRRMFRKHTGVAQLAREWMR